MSALNTGTQWQEVSAAGGVALPAWAQFMIKLGRHAGIEFVSHPRRVSWRIVTVPHRNFAAGLFALGFLEASIDEILKRIDSIDLSALSDDQPITWRRTDDTIAFGRYIGFEPKTDKDDEDMVRYRTASAQEVKRTMSGARKFNLAPYFGKEFKHSRAMSRNLDFFKTFFPHRWTDLLCNTVPMICMIGRPVLWDDLRAHELSIGGTTGCLDDLLRVSGDNEDASEDVSHYFSRFVTPNRSELEEVTATCAVFDGSWAYPKLKNFVTANQNLIVLDRWETGAQDAANAFVADYEHVGAAVSLSAGNLDVPATIEYRQWSRPSE